MVLFLRKLEVNTSKLKVVVSHITSDICKKVGVYLSRYSGIAALIALESKPSVNLVTKVGIPIYDSIATVGETGVWLRADFQSGSRVLKKVF